MRFCFAPHSPKRRFYPLYLRPLVNYQLHLQFSTSPSSLSDYLPSSYLVSFLLVCFQLFDILWCLVCDVWFEWSVVWTLFEVVCLSEQNGIVVVSTVVPHPSWVLTLFTKWDNIFHLIHRKVGSTHFISYLSSFFNLISCCSPLSLHLGTPVFLSSFLSPPLPSVVWLVILLGGWWLVWVWCGVNLIWIGWTSEKTGIKVTSIVVPHP